jgi:hypothetical protein
MACLGGKWTGELKEGWAVRNAELEAENKEPVAEGTLFTFCGPPADGVQGHWGTRTRGWTSYR